MKQFNNSTVSSVSLGSKKALGNLFVILVVILAILPFFTTFEEFLTRIIEQTPLFRFMERVIVPYEVNLVRTIISAFGIKTANGTVAVVKDGVNFGTYIAWNCIGWQSLVILLVSLKAGLAGGFTRTSKLEVILFALLGTFFINLARISIILIMLYYLGKGPAFLYHDYFSSIMSILWLFFFWWFVYSFVLEEKRE